MWGERRGEKKRGLKGCCKKDAVLLLIKNYFFRPRIYMTKKKASLPFNISSSCLSSSLQERKGRGKGRQTRLQVAGCDFDSSPPPVGGIRETSAGGQRSSSRFPNLISSPCAYLSIYLLRWPSEFQNLVLFYPHVPICLASNLSLKERVEHFSKNFTVQKQLHTSIG